MRLVAGFLAYLGCLLFPIFACCQVPLSFSTPQEAPETGITLLSVQSSPTLLATSPVKKPQFQFKRALFESMTFLAIEQAFVVHDDYAWVISENGIPFNHYWRDYKHSLSTWIHSGWDDGDSFITNYIGHPIQGALTAYIQVQNDPQGERLEFAMSKEYWWSRFKAMMWSAAYSTQWKIGPLSEMTVEKYGTKIRGRWNHDGTWPCSTRNCVTGVGQVDLVVTPTAGLAWLVTEDVLDRVLIRRMEDARGKGLAVNFVRCALNPVRGGANILHGRRPWYRASRDHSEVLVLK